MNAAVFLDRDNTIIHNDGDLGDPNQVKLIQGAASAIASLRGLNYKIIVITNQGGVARGKYGEADVEKTNQRVADLVKAASGANIDRFYYCPYHPNGSVAQYATEHPWRKPQPGMLLQAAKDLQIDLSKSWMIGDQMRDVQAGHAAGTRCILLREDAQELGSARNDQLKAGHIEVTDDIHHFTAKSMIEAVRIVAKLRKPEAELQGEPARKKWDAAAVKSARENLNTPTDTPTPNQHANEPSPARSDDGNVDHPAANSAAKPVKPFKPWGVSGPAASPVVTQKKDLHEPPAAPVVTPAVTPVVAPVTPEPVDHGLEPHEIEAMVSRDEAGQNEAADSNVSVATEANADESAPVEMSKTPATAGRRSPSSDVTLRQILQELRGQRTVQNDFSYLRMLAVVLQIVAVFLLVAGLLLGATEVGTFLRWISTAVLVQLAAIALILLER